MTQTSTPERHEEEQRDAPQELDPPHARPDDNGDRDEPAIAAGQGRLEQVLGW